MKLIRVKCKDAITTKPRSSELSDQYADEVTNLLISVREKIKKDLAGTTYYASIGTRLKDVIRDAKFVKNIPGQDYRLKASVGLQSDINRIKSEVRVFVYPKTYSEFDDIIKVMIKWRDILRWARV